MASRRTRLKLNVEEGRLRMCASEKIGFPTRAQALDACEKMMARGLVNQGCHMTPCPCRDCGRWHVYNRRIVDVRTGEFVASARGTA